MSIQFIKSFFPIKFYPQRVFIPLVAGFTKMSQAIGVPTETARKVFMGLGPPMENILSPIFTKLQMMSHNIRGERVRDSLIAHALQKTTPHQVAQTMQSLYHDPLQAFLHKFGKPKSK